MIWFSHYQHANKDRTNNLEGFVGNQLPAKYYFGAFISLLEGRVAIVFDYQIIPNIKLTCWLSNNVFISNINDFRLSRTLKL